MIEKREDLVNPTYEATTDIYHAVVDDLLNKIVSSNQNKLQVTFATHNEDTVKYVVVKYVTLCHVTLCRQSCYVSLFSLRCQIL